MAMAIAPVWPQEALTRLGMSAKLVRREGIEPSTY